MASTVAGLLKDTKAALLAAIAARPGVADVQVSPTHPAGAVDSTATVFINEISGDSDWAQLGQFKREVDPITIEVVVQTALAGGLDQQAVAEAAAWDLAAEVEAAVTGDPTLNGTVRSALATNAELTNVRVDTAWATQIVVTVQAQARITT